MGAPRLRPVLWAQDRGPLCRASTCFHHQGELSSQQFRKRSDYWNAAGRASLCPPRGLQGCSHHALLLLLTHRCQGTEPAGHGRSFRICRLADSTHLPLPLSSNLTDGTVGSRWHRGIRGQQSPLECHLFRGRPPVLLARRLPWALPWVLFLLPSHPGSAESRRAQDPFCLQGISRPSHSKQPCGLLSTCWSAPSLRKQAAGAAVSSSSCLSVHDPRGRTILTPWSLAALLASPPVTFPTLPPSAPFRCSHPGPRTSSGKETQAPPPPLALAPPPAPASSRARLVSGNGSRPYSPPRPPLAPALGPAPGQTPAWLTHTCRRARLPSAVTSPLLLSRGWAARGPTCVPAAAERHPRLRLHQETGSQRGALRPSSPRLPADRAFSSRKPAAPSSGPTPSGCSSLSLLLDPCFLISRKFSLEGGELARELGTQMALKFSTCRLAKVGRGGGASPQHTVFWVAVVFGPRVSLSGCLLGMNEL